ncbi:MAG: glutathione synthase, partial [Candidatus Limnocylindrus sp.]
STMLLDRHDPSRTLVPNTPSSLRIANEKLWGLFAAELGPHTVVSARREVLLEELARLGRAVLKPISGAGGSGVMVFDHGDKNVRSAIDILTQEGRRVAVLQEYLPAVRRGDKRVILLGGDPIGAVWRVPQGDDHRANMHVGGAAQRAEIEEDDRRIAARLKPELLKLGLHFVGIDVIGGRLTEVNVTSPTGVQEIDRLDGRQGAECLSAQVMDYVEKLSAGLV